MGSFTHAPPAGNRGAHYIAGTGADGVGARRAARAKQLRHNPYCTFYNGPGPSNFRFAAANGTPD